jgi:NAD+ synthase (glutamine-hydrolysing)
MRIYIAQLNLTVGDLSQNEELIRRAYRRGAAAGAEVVVVPELAVTGYPPRDLLERESFVAASLSVRDGLARMTEETALVFGCITRNASSVGKPLHNAAIVAQNGAVVLAQAKRLLPTYDIFDERRYFEPGTGGGVVELQGKRVGISICEDLWFEHHVPGRRLYATDPLESLAGRRCELLINLSASPFNVRKRHLRHDVFGRVAQKHRIPIVYVNQVGGNDELLFDGSSVVFDERGAPAFCARSFAEDEAMVTVGGTASAGEQLVAMSDEEEIAAALTLGLRDYVHKCGFRDVVLGLSGGIDSAVAATLAVDALGSARVTGISMPSPFSSGGSVADAEALAANLGIRCHPYPIEQIFRAYTDALARMFGHDRFTLAHENVQARVRGNLLMAWSNETAAMVLSTGNKSELAVGYCTLYGDMAGGLAVLGDVYKTMVYRVARWLNRGGERIPLASIEKPPSAELRPEQTDQETLPPYDVLDAILNLYIEEAQDVAAIVARGFDRALVERIVGLVDGNEFKRCQAAPTIRVTTKAFGSGRQMPIAQGWTRSRFGARPAVDR